MKDFLNELSIKVQYAVEKDMKEIVKDVGKEQIYVASLVTDSDYTSLYFAVNTFERMKQKDEKYLDMLKSSLPSEKIEAIKRGNASFIKWIPAEWEYSKGKTSELAKISEMLFAKEKRNPKEYKKNKQSIMNTIILGYKKAIAEKILEKNSVEIVYFISTSDGEQMQELENYSSKELNTEEIHAKFLRRFEEVIC